MSRRASLVLTVASALSLLILGASPQTLQAGGGAPPDTLLVTLVRGTEAAAAEALFQSAGVRVLDAVRPLPVYRVAPGGDPADALKVLRASPNVRDAQPEGEQVIQLVPNDALYRAYQWNVRRIGAETAWDLRPTAPEVVVAVLDTGVDLSHPDLQPNLLVDQGYDFINETPVPQDDESHGTAVAGIIGAVGNNREGVAGIAWRVKILPIKALNARGRGPDSAMVKAIVYAVDAGARILNISSTGSRYSAALEEAVAYARDRGVLIVAAAGNTGNQDNEPTYPAAFEGVLAVGAVDERDQMAPFSQHGPFIQLVAPGVDVPSTTWRGAGRGAYASQSGTSIAAPHVSGVAALLWAMRPDLSATQIAETLRATAEDLGPPGADDAFGAGLVSAARAAATLRLGVRPADDGVAFRPEPLAAGAAPPPPPLPLESRRWYFAEGSTNPPFDTWFALQNPSDRAANVRFTFLTPGGAQRTQEVWVAANGRAALYANQVVPAAEFGTVVQSDGPVYVERSMYFGHDGQSSTGVREPARTWYLAEGSTAPNFDTWLLLTNPNPAPAQARLTFMREDGSIVERLEPLAPFGRRSVYVNALFAAAGFSTQVQADQPIVVERAMYFDGGQGGHETVAAPAPAKTWYLAEGVSRDGFDTWVLVQNPGLAPASVRVSFLTETGTTVATPLLVAPRSRASLYANAVLPNAAFGVKLESDQPVVAEEAVYFDSGRAGFAEAGVAAPATEWFLPEGTTSGSFVEQLAILNPQPQPASVRVDFQRQDGETVVPLRFAVGPGSVLRLDVNAYVPDASVAARISADRPVVASRTTFFARPTGVGATSSTGLTR